MTDDRADGRADEDADDAATDRTDAQTAPADEDDDLLKTIRRMVIEENARTPGTAHLAGPTARAVRSSRLVLEGAARIGTPAPGPAAPVPAPAAPMYDDAALRPLVTEMVREELAALTGDALDHRIRKIVRRELSDLLARRGGDD